MSELYHQSYFDNIQLIKLVSSAETLLQHLYSLVSQEDKLFIEQWLCFKQEYDACSNNNSCIDETIHPENDLSSANCIDSGSETENDTSSSVSSDQDVDSSGFESSSQIVLDEYTNDFKKFTDTFIRLWFSNLNMKLNESAVHEVNADELIPYQNVPLPIENAAAAPWSLMDPEVRNFKLCHCCASQKHNCFVTLSVPAEDQVAALRKLKEPLTESCFQHTKLIKRLDNETTLNEDLIVFQETIELIDVVIEVKNNLKVVEKKMRMLMETNEQVYNSMMGCVKMLSTNEIRYLFVFLLSKIANLRKNSSTLDRLILQLDNTIVDREVRLRHLVINYEKLRGILINGRRTRSTATSAIDQASTSRAEETCSSSSSSQNTERVDREPAASQDQIFSLDEAGGSSSSAGSSQNAERVDRRPVVSQDDSALPSSSLPEIPARNIRTLRRSNTMRNLGVTRQRKKIIIQQQEQRNEDQESD